MSGPRPSLPMSLLCLHSVGSEPGLQVLPEVFTSPCPSPTLRHTHSPLSVCPSALPASQHGASGAVHEDATNAESGQHTSSIYDSSRGQRYRLTCSTSVVQPGGLCAQSTVLPTPSFWTATLPDSCVCTVRPPCATRECSLAWLKQLGSPDSAARVCLVG